MTADDHPCWPQAPIAQILELQPDQEALDRLILAQLRGLLVCIILRQALMAPRRVQAVAPLQVRRARAKGSGQNAIPQPVSRFQQAAYLVSPPASHRQQPKP